MNKEEIWKSKYKIMDSLDNLYALVQNEVPTSDLPTKEDIDISFDKVILQLLEAKRSMVNYYNIK